jgi:hypothetical protein
VPALFRATSNAPFRAAVIGVAIVATFALIAPMLYVRTPYAAGVGDAVEQPVEFDHRHHVRDDGIDCVYCHDTVETDAFAGMPSTERCMGCHGQVWPESPELEPVRESWRTRTPIRWKRVDSVPAYVYFHHGVHVQAGVMCAECHGRVEDMARVMRVQNFTMDFCLECHRRQQGSRAITRLTSCSACHR